MAAFYIKGQYMRYENITTYAVNRDFDSNYKEINSLIRENLKNNTMPVISDKTFPPDMNIITGKTRMDINKEKIALKAASIGATSTMWIYGADAAQLGLELKAKNPVEYQKAVKQNPNYNCRPVVIQNARERFSDKDMSFKSNTLSESLCIDCQCAYLLDQFTEKSVERLFTEKLLQNKIPYAVYMAKEIIANRNEYNTGEMQIERTKHIKQNLFLNLQKSSPVFQEIVNKRNSIYKNYLPEQKVIFECYYKHFNEQASGEKLYNFSAEEKKNILKAFNSLMSKIDENKENKNISGIISRTIFDAYSFSERLTHYNFSLEPIYTRDEQIKKDANRRVPAAMQQELKNKSKTVQNEQTKQKFKRPTFSMHVGEDRGL